MLLSIVTTLYRSAPFIAEFYERVSHVAKTLSPSYEIVFVNDGSPDDSLERAIELNEADPRVKVVDLSRNFGHHKALLAGLEHAEGDLVFLIDSDLEEEPEALGPLFNLLRETGADVAYGVRESRHGTLMQRMGGRAYFAVYNAFSSQPIPTNMCTARVMTRRYVDSLLRHRESEVVLSGVMALTGYRQVPLRMRKLHKGSSSYSLTRNTSLLIDSVTSQSSKPLVWIFVVGIAISLATGALMMLVFLRRVISGVEVEGWTSLILSIWMIGGLILFSQGMIAIYIAKIFLEVKQRPRTITRHVYGQQATPEPSFTSNQLAPSNGKQGVVIGASVSPPKEESQEWTS